MSPPEFHRGVNPDFTLEATSISLKFGKLPVAWFMVYCFRVIVFGDEG